MRSDKMNRALDAYTGFKGNQTVTEILSTIPQDLLSSLTGAQIGAVMNAVNTAYHNGKTASKDSECLWIDAANVLLPRAALNTVKKENGTEFRIHESHGYPVTAIPLNTFFADAECTTPLNSYSEITKQLNAAGKYYRRERVSVHTYTMNFTEKF